MLQMIRVPKYSVDKFKAWLYIACLVSWASYDLRKFPKECKKFTMQSISGMMSKTLGDRQKFATALKTYPWTSKHQKNCKKTSKNIVGEKISRPLASF